MTGAAAKTRLLALSLLVVAGVACEVDEGQRPENLPPDTFLFVQAESLATVHYRQKISWWGSDLDGLVVAYLYRLSGPWTPEPGDSLWETDPSWIWTTATTDTFNIPVDGTLAERTFEVRAVDDQGFIDPSPASQAFRARNFPPTIRWSDDFDLPERSLPATSFAWSPSDPDGRSTVNRALMWLASDSAATVRVIDGGDTVASVLPEQFIFGFGREYTLKIQAVDDAATPSNVLEHTWFVEDVSGKDILVIDNVDVFLVPGGLQDDNYHLGLVQAVAGDSYYVIDVRRDGGFRSDKEVLPLFQLFDAVVWYSGPSTGSGGEVGYDEGRNDERMRENLEIAERGLEEYLNLGGRVFLSATNLFGTLGGLSGRFLHEVAGVETLYTWRHIDFGSISDHVLPADTVSVSATVLNPSADPADPPDYMVMSQSLLRIEFFSAPAPDERSLWMAPGKVDTRRIPQYASSEFHCGIRRRVGPGRLAFTTFPMSRASAGGDNQAVGRALLEWLLAP